LRSAITEITKQVNQSSSIVDKAIRGEWNAASSHERFIGYGCGKEDRNLGG